MPIVDYRAFQTRQNFVQAYTNLCRGLKEQRGREPAPGTVPNPASGFSISPYCFGTGFGRESATTTSVTLPTSTWAGAVPAIFDTESGFSDVTT